MVELTHDPTDAMLGWQVGLTRVCKRNDEQRASGFLTLEQGGC